VSSLALLARSYDFLENLWFSMAEKNFDDFTTSRRAWRRWRSNVTLVSVQTPQESPANEGLFSWRA